MKLPDSWKENRLKDIAVHKTAKNKDLKYTETYTNSATLGIVRQMDYFDKEISNKENIAGYYIVEEGDYVYNPRISASAPCGPISKSHIKETGIMSPLYTVFKITEKNLSDDYLEQYFKSTFWHSYMKTVANYGARYDRMNITTEDFFNIPIPFPPLAEQQKIADILCEQDKIISLKQKLLEQNQKQKKWLMQKLLEVPLTDANDEEKFSLDGVVIDKSRWKKEILGCICTITGRIGFRGYTRSDITSSDKGVLSLSPSNIIDGQLNMEDSTFITLEKYLESPEIMIQKHDIVFVKTGSTFGKVGYLDSIYQKATINPQLVIVRSNNLVRQNLLYYILKSDYFQNFVNKIVVGGAVPTLSQEQLSKIMIHLPTLPEQKIIAQVLSTADKEIALLKSIIEQEKQKKKSLAQLLLTGTVRVNT